MRTPRPRPLRSDAAEAILPAFAASEFRPKSFHARIEERYKRVDADTFTIQFNLYDPEYYTATWDGDVKTIKRMKPDTYTYFGWKGLFGGITDAICAPENEVENYNKRFRDPGTVGLSPEKK